MVKKRTEKTELLISTKKTVRIPLSITIHIIINRIISSHPRFHLINNMQIIRLSSQTGITMNSGSNFVLVLSELGITVQIIVHLVFTIHVVVKFVRDFTDFDVNF